MIKYVGGSKFINGVHTCIMYYVLFNCLDIFLRTICRMYHAQHQLRMEEKEEEEENISLIFFSFLLFSSPPSSSRISSIDIVFGTTQHAGRFSSPEYSPSHPQNIGGDAHALPSNRLARTCVQDANSMAKPLQASLS